MKKTLLSLAVFLLFSFVLNAQTTYYWVGANGSATSATPWNVTTNWNTSIDGSGSARTTPSVTDTLVISGKSPFLQMVTDSVAALKIINSSSVTISASSGTELLTSANVIGAAAVGTVAIPDSVLPAGGSPFANVYAGNYISSTNLPGSLGQILSVLDVQHITIANEAGISGANLYRIPTLIIKGLLITDASSTLYAGSNINTTGYSTPLFSLFLAPGATGAVSSPITYQRNGSNVRFVASTAGSLVINSTVNISGCNPGAFASGAAVTYVGPIFGTALGTGFARSTGNTFAFAVNAPTILFASGSSFINATTYKPYSPYGVAIYATSPLSFSPVISFQPGSNYVHGYSSAYIPYFYSNAIVGFGNLTMSSVPSASATIRFNLAATRIDTLTITNAGVPTATTTTGIAAIYGNINCQVNGGLNFGNPALNGTALQKIYGTYSASFNTLTINNALGVTFSGANSDTISTLVQNAGPLTVGNGLTATSVKLGIGSSTIGATGSLNVAALSTADFNSRPVTLQSSALGTASIGTVSGTLSNATNVTVQRFIPSNGRKRYTMVTSPVSGSTINAAWQEAGAAISGYGTHITGGTIGTYAANGFDTTSASGLPSIYTYNDANANGSKWVGLTNTNVNTLAPGAGYLLYVRGDRSEARYTTGNSSNTTLRATGTLTTGNFTPVLTTILADKFNLVANPYASAITWTGLTKANLTGSFYVYDPNLAVFVTSNGTTVSPSSSQQRKDTIQSGQAFFIQNASSGAPSIMFTESSKVGTGLTASANTVFSESSAASQLNINVYNKSNELADGVVALFGNDYKAGLGKEDAVKMDNFNETFSLTRNNNRLSIEGRPMIKGNDTLFFAMSNFGKKEYVLQIDGANFSEANATLIDNYTGAKTALDLAGITAYNFAVNADAASADASRFVITLGNTSVTTQVADIANSSKMFVKVGPNPMSNQLQVSFKTATAENTVIKIFNSIGQEVKNVNAGKVNTGNITIGAGNLAAGTYTVQLISGDKNIATQKIIKE